MIFSCALILWLFVNKTARYVSYIKYSTWETMLHFHEN